MSITTDWQVLYEEYVQNSAAIAARKSLNRFYLTAIETNNTIQKLVDSGNFNLIPQSIKVALNQCWALNKSLIVDIEANPDIVEILSAKFTPDT